jgi:hypothetical protein
MKDSFEEKLIFNFVSQSFYFFGVVDAFVDVFFFEPFVDPVATLLPFDFFDVGVVGGEVFYVGLGEEEDDSGEVVWVAGEVFFFENKVFGDFFSFGVLPFGVNGAVEVGFFFEAEALATSPVANIIRTRFFQ